VSRSRPIATAAGVEPFADLGAPEALDRLVPGPGAWEIELGFGKGRFLLARAAAEPAQRFLGIEAAGEYFRLAAGRLRRRGLANVALLQGDALALLATAVPPAFAEAVHVYFPDPWPKSRHAQRRLLQRETLDVLLGVLAPGGRLLVATDHAAYAAEIRDLLEGCAALAVERFDAGWPGGPRTNYEAKYVALGRPIVRFEAVLSGGPAPIPAGLEKLVVAFGPEPASAEANGAA
jgi:tRNA (guanine-N7-)-methyltransferase